VNFSSMAAEFSGVDCTSGG